MGGELATLTLLDDWQARRERLASGRAASGPHVEPQIQVLDYLVDRYRDSPEAAQPARCPVRPELFVNDRAVVVHDHFWEGKVGGAKTQKEAEQRVVSIVSRMASQEMPVDKEVDYGIEGQVEDHINEHIDEHVGWQDVSKTLRRPMGWARRAFLSLRGFLAEFTRSSMLLARQLTRLSRLRRIELFLESSRYLRPAVMEYLRGTVADPNRDEPLAVDLLGRSENPSMLACAALAWRERIAARCDDQTTRKLRELLCRPDLRDQAVQKIGAMLADPNAQVRVEATIVFGQIGSLEHVGMLSDLVNLPPQRDEHPRERDALIRAMQRISRRA